MPINKAPDTRSRPAKARDTLSAAEVSTEHWLSRHSTVLAAFLTGLIVGSVLRVL